MTTIWMFPGQGSQKRGMGAGLFERFPAQLQEADAILGYSVRTLCVENPDGKLDDTRYTQPALYVVGALGWLDCDCRAPLSGCAIGHSLGEYAALFAAGVFDFGTGLQLVARRGELMGQASGGGMAAVLGLTGEQLERVLREEGEERLDLANINTPTQVVLAGPLEALQRVTPAIQKAGAKYVVPLRVRAAFHSRYMKAAADEYRRFLERFSFSSPQLAVYSNVNALPYERAQVAQLLADQISHPVRWLEVVRRCLAHSEPEFVEVGGGQTLSKMAQEIRGACSPLPLPPPAVADPEPRSGTVIRMEAARNREDKASSSTAAAALGSRGFMREFSIRQPYMAGSMYRGIASEALVASMAEAGFLASFGAGGLDLERVDEGVQKIRRRIGNAHPFAVNLLHDYGHPQRELELVQHLIDGGENIIEASAFMGLTPALVYYRAKGLSVQPDGSLRAANRIIAKVSRPEVAEVFMRPPPEASSRELVQRGLLTQQEVTLASRLPLADAVTAEADSGGHTDKATLTALVPAILALRDRCAGAAGRAIYVGAAGGLGTPSAVAAAFVLGADYVVTGSINQCTVESGASDAVKELLQQVEIQDTSMAPAGDMFELGARIQVVRRGVLFPVRANKLYELYRTHNSLEEIDGETRKQIETKYFRRSFEEVYRETERYFSTRDPSVIERAERDAKHKMALVFRWYFAHSSRLAAQGVASERVDYQVHCGPAMGAFNAWARATDIEPWQKRRVADIANRLMQGALQRLSSLRAHTGELADPAAVDAEPGLASAQRSQRAAEVRA